MKCITFFHKRAADMMTPVRLAALILFSLYLTACAAPQSLIPLDEAGLKALLADNRGRVILLNFWATWCEPCREEIPELIDLQRNLGGRGLKLILVSADEPEDENAARQFLKKAGFGGRSYIKRARSDESFINSVDPQWTGALPALFFYDRKGAKVRSLIGESGGDAIRAVEKLL